MYITLSATPSAKLGRNYQRVSPSSKKKGSSGNFLHSMNTLADYYLLVRAGFFSSACTLSSKTFSGAFKTTV